MVHTSPPTGSVTFQALADHDAILRTAIENHAGHMFKTIGDAFCAAFATPYDALVAAMDLETACQLGLSDPRSVS